MGMRPPIDFIVAALPGRSEFVHQCRPMASGASFFMEGKGTKYRVWFRGIQEPVWLLSDIPGWQGILVAYVTDAIRGAVTIGYYCEAEDWDEMGGARRHDKRQ